MQILEKRLREQLAELDRELTGGDVLKQARSIPIPSRGARRWQR